MDERVQTVQIEQRKKIIMTCVESVDSFSTQQISLTVEGGKAVITGETLKIVNFSKSNGNFAAEGKITGLKYLGKRDKITKRLFR